MIGVLWALGLWFAAPVLRLRTPAGAYSYADRIRDAIVIGVALPAALSLVNLLWPVTLAIGLAILIVLARRVKTESAGEPLPIVTIATIAFLAWPSLTRPPLDGDTIWYHLPNAASWVHRHGIWVTTTQYWWYPPASELFASALYALGGGAAVGFSGLAAMTLLASRIVTWSRVRCGCSPLLADLLGAATIASLPLALQAGTMQNDVWQAAFLLELLWNVNVAEADVAGIASTLVCSLIKPDGWLFALIALAASRARAKYWSAWAIAFAFLVARALALWRDAVFPIGATAQPHNFDTAIVGHGAGAIALAFALALRAAPLASLALAAAVLGPLLARKDRALGWTALGSAAAFFLTPWGFADAHPQLATGASLRYADPAMAAGVLVLAPYARRVEVASMAALAACVLYGCVQVGAIFWNDQTTRLALPIALLCAGAAYLTRKVPYALALTATIVALVAAWHSGLPPAQYYADSLAVRGTGSGVFAWIARTKPPRVSVLGFPPGSVAVLSPRSLIIETIDENACAIARANGTILIAMSEPTRDPLANAARLAHVRACGTLLYRDPIAIAILP